MLNKCYVKFGTSPEFSGLHENNFISVAISYLFQYHIYTSGYIILIGIFVSMIKFSTLKKEHHYVIDSAPINSFQTQALHLSAIFMYPYAQSYINMYICIFFVYNIHPVNGQWRCLHSYPHPIRIYNE